MQLKTPTRLNYEKKLHSPPSLERENGWQTPTKFLRNLSGKVFRSKTPEINKGKFENEKASSGLYTPALGLKMSKRSNVPKPLDLTKPLSPPPSLRKQISLSRSGSTVGSLKNEDFFSLDSPVNLRSKTGLSYNNTSRNLTSSLMQESLSDGSTLNNEGILLCADTEDGPYLEEDSPTYLSSFARNVRMTKAGPKRFVGNKCSLCEEMISSTFKGEKIVELECDHISHYQCYITVFDSVYLDEVMPTCRVCNKMVKPKDDELLQDMTSRVLSGDISSDGEMSSSTLGTTEQWIDLKSAKTFDGKFPAFTPRDQVIRTADITSNGFRTPSLSRFDNEQVSPFHGGCNSPLVEEIVPIYDPFKEEIVALDCKMQNEPKLRLGKTEDDKLVLSVLIPGQKQNSIEKDKDIHEDEDDMSVEAIEFLSTQAENLIKKSIGLDEPLGKLCIFEELQFSTDDDHWTNVIGYLFSSYLLLIDVRTQLIVGKIPTEQISKVTQITKGNLMIDLKSTVLPEIYLKFEGTSVDQSLVDKWKYYLEHRDEYPGLNYVTSMSWTVLPETLVSEINKCIAPRSTRHPWDSETCETSLEVIVCLNLCSSIDTPDHERDVMNSLRSIFNSLKDDDLFGLVTVGKDGSGERGEFGTFIGTVEKKWDGWNDIFEELELTFYQDNKFFQDCNVEKLEMLRTCTRIANMSTRPLDLNNSVAYQRHVIMLRESHESTEEESLKILRMKDVLEHDHSVALLEIEPEPERADGNAVLASPLQKLIENLHGAMLFDLNVNLLERKICFGNMRSGEEKTLPLDGIHLHELADDGTNCSVQWFDGQTHHKLERRITATHN
ncbi:hypothetical protein NCAS_0I02790 [Naumovozyma castellii]|uniref:RING-type domain-containing protein n=1 Tax=Naumovozyma castellii TaxID=27288 RepID=G0VKB3_NAUCA|nr:hypothetical protein NCAS_0I02790 [Naumovozyma castellii CBS 4309]CCC71947.1 hypothetical protein NCAS_0I02790 [Naumovozyma castellii CBS 4309]